MPGLLINGKLVPVPGARVISPGELPWVRLDSGDFTTRLVQPQQAILHKTIADDPEYILAGDPPTDGAGGAQYTAEYWQGDPAHSGAHNIIGHDGTVVNLADLGTTCAYHANQANLLSYGTEIKERTGGGVYNKALLSAVMCTLTATRALGIQWQAPRSFRGPLKRFVNGGSDLIGIFGHREVTNRRNEWDPGGIIFRMLEQAGVEVFDFAAGEDRDVWAKRQRWLVSLGYQIGAVDGIPGKRTTAALKELGYLDGIFATWRMMAEKPPMPPA